jgi:hypothetical protein
VSNAVDGERQPKEQQPNASSENSNSEATDDSRAEAI